MDFYTGQQVVYAPDGSDLEYGFVTSVQDSRVWCRFFSDKSASRLRTTANSEAVRARDLRPYNFTSESKIKEAMTKC